MVNVKPKNKLNGNVSFHKSGPAETLANLLADPEFRLKARTEPGLAFTLGRKLFFIESGQIMALLSSRSATIDRLNRELSQTRQAERVARMGSWSWELATGEIHCSAGLTYILGQTPAADKGGRDQLLSPVHPEDREMVRQAFDSSIHQGNSYDLRYRIIQPDGTPRLVRDRGEAMADDTGKPVRMIGVVHDITEHKRVTEQLLLNDHLASLGEMVSGIAHELTNPLTGIIGLSELILNADVPAEIKDDLKVLNMEAQRTSRIVRNLLTFARKHKLEKKPVNLNDVIKAALELRSYEMKVNNIRVETRLADRLPRIMADSFQLQQVFFNLIINAEYFMLQAHGKGVLRIETTAVPRGVRASLRDDGPGIATENRPYLFTPFFTTKESGRGTGLGLSICYGIITEHGGTISLESEPGKGAEFTVALPAGQPLPA